MARRKVGNKYWARTLAKEGEIVRRAVRVRAFRSSKSVQILLDSARHTVSQ
jgi:hypothetical protein